MIAPDGYCRNLHTVNPGDHLPAGTCDQCGHALLAHIGVDHCPVCELVNTAERHRAAFEPDQVEGAPKTGDRLHLWSAKYGCLAGAVERHMVFGPGLLIRVDLRDFPLDSLVADSHDESRTANGSWHWPCSGDGHAAEPTPDAPAPNITINVHGTVLNEHDLRDAIQKQIGMTISQSWARQGQYRR